MAWKKFKYYRTIENKFNEKLLEKLQKEDFEKNESSTNVLPENQKYAGAELGQAQLKLGQSFPSIEMSGIDAQKILLASLIATNH